MLNCNIRRMSQACNTRTWGRRTHNRNLCHTIKSLRLRPSCLHGIRHRIIQIDGSQRVSLVNQISNRGLELLQLLLLGEYLLDGGPLKKLGVPANEIDVVSVIICMSRAK